MNENLRPSEPVKRNSIQKQMIADAFRFLRHPTAGDIYEFIRSNYPGISLATVYRNLGQMYESGTVEKITFPDEPDRFELKRKPHFHAICTRCGRVADVEGIDESMLRRLDECVAARDGFVIEARNLNFFGICKTCREGDSPRAE